MTGRLGMAPVVSWRRRHLARAGRWLIHEIPHHPLASRMPPLADVLGAPTGTLAKLGYLGARVREVSPIVRHRWVHMSRIVSLKKGRVEDAAGLDDGSQAC